MDRASNALAVAFLVVACGVCSIAVAQTTTSAANAGESNLVAVKIWLDQDQIPSRATVRVWLAVENNSPMFNLSDVVVDEFDTTGFDKPECWRGAHQCRDTDNAFDSLPDIPAG